MAEPSPSRDVRIPGTQSGANDLATFGASPAAFAVFAPAAFGDGSAVAAPAAFHVREAASNSGAASPTHSSTTSADEESGGPPPTNTPSDTAAVSTSAVTPVADAAAVDAPQSPDASLTSAGIATFVPAPQGSGAVSSAPPPDDDGAVAQAQAVAMMPGVTAAPATDPVAGSVAAMQEMVAAMAQQGVPATPGDTIDQAVAPVTAAVTTTTASVVDASDAVAARIDDVTATVQSLADTASASVASLTEGVTATVGTLTGNLAASVATVSDTVTAQIAAVASDVAATVAAVADPVASVGATASNLLDSVTEGLSGGDPAAGITTLVGLVSAADAFDLSDIGSPIGDLLTPALGSLGAVDLLADVVPGDVLLGIAGDHDGGVLGALHLDDGAHGLLGL